MADKPEQKQQKSAETKEENKAGPKEEQQIQQQFSNIKIAKDIKELPKHKLQDSWVFWTSPRGKEANISADKYESCLTNLGEVSTVEEFFQFYCYLKRPSEIEQQQKIMFFRKGQKPLWENYPTGGTWILLLKKRDHESLNLAWEALLLSLISEAFEDSNVVGLVLSLREKHNLFEVWLQDRQNEEKRKSIGEKMCSLMNIDVQNLQFYFKDHQSQLQDKSTIRNAQQYDFYITPNIQTPNVMPKEIENNQEKQKELNNFQL